MLCTRFSIVVYVRAHNKFSLKIVFLTRLPDACYRIIILYIIFLLHPFTEGLLSIIIIIMTLRGKELAGGKRRKTFFYVRNPSKTKLKRP